MLKFEKINVNPKGRKTGDCSTRALVSLLDISYDTALLEQTNEALKCYYDISSKQTMDRVLNKYGYVKIKQPRKADGKKYKVYELDSLLSQRDLMEGIIVLVANHWTCIKNQKIVDSWDCGYKSVGNYWVKGGITNAR